jgi:hypothetical protein
MIFSSFLIIRVIFPALIEVAITKIQFKIEKNQSDNIIPVVIELLSVARFQNTGDNLNLYNLKNTVRDLHLINCSDLFF